MQLSESGDMIKTFSLDGADPSFDMRILP